MYLFNTFKKKLQEKTANLQEKPGTQRIFFIYYFTVILTVIFLLFKKIFLVYYFTVMLLFISVILMFISGASGAAK